MKEYTVKEFAKITNNSEIKIRHQIRKGFLKTKIIKKNTVIIMYKGNPDKYKLIIKPTKKKYIKGSKKGLLTFIERTKTHFKCKCSCGNIIEVTKTMFYNGNPDTLSCGCNKKEIEAAKKRIKINKPKKQYTDNVTTDLIMLCKRFGVLDLLNTDNKTFDGREIKVLERKYVFKDDNSKVIKTIYDNYGYKRLSFSEEIVKRRT